MDVQSEIDLVPQWTSSYFAKAFPFVIPRAVSGPDFPGKDRERRPQIRKGEGPGFLEPLDFARMLATRVEASVRNDWLAVPAARNLGTKWKALCGNDAAVTHYVDRDRVGIENAAALSEAAGSCYEKLHSGCASPSPKSMPDKSKQRSAA